MSYPIPWRYPKDRFFDPNEFNIVAWNPLSRKPFKCDEHSDCFKVLMDSAADGGGWWDIRTPIDILGQMPGSGQRLTGFHYECMHQYGFACAPSDVGTSVILKKDGGTFYDRRVNCPKDVWYSGDALLDEDLSANLQLTVHLFQVVTALTCLSWATCHFRNFYLTGIYYSTTPPPTATVEIDVWDLETHEMISGAEVRLLSDVYSYGPAYTDGGMATLTGVYYGDYTLRISKTGYKTLSTPLSVQTSLVHPATPFSLEFVGGFILPWWWWVPVAAGGGLIGLYLITRALRKPRPPTPPVYIMR